MATLSTLTFLLLLTITPLLIFNLPQTHAQSPPPPPANVTAPLDKAGQFTVFIRLLKETQLANQINSQLNTSTQGMTVFAPTDNAFSNLPPGTLNKLSNKQQIQLIQYHVLEKFYTQETLEIISNPVRTQASGQDGHQFVLNFIGHANHQLNVSTGAVDTQVYNGLRKEPPLAVYQVDKVLLPVEFAMSPAPVASPPSSTGKGKEDGGAADMSSAQEPSMEPSTSCGKMSSRLGLILGVFMICMGVVS